MMLYVFHMQDKCYWTASLQFIGGSQMKPICIILMQILHKFHNMYYTEEERDREMADLHHIQRMKPFQELC